MWICASPEAHKVLNVSRWEAVASTVSAIRSRSVVICNISRPSAAYNETFRKLSRDVKNSPVTDDQGCGENVYDETQEVRLSFELNRPQEVYERGRSLPPLEDK